MDIVSTPNKMILCLYVSDWNVYRWLVDILLPLIVVTVIFFNS